MGTTLESQLAIYVVMVEELNTGLSCHSFSKIRRGGVKLFSQ